MLSGLISARAQSLPDSVTLPPVNITGQRSQVFQTGLRVTVLDSNTLAADPTADLGEVLSRHGSVFVKDYGPGSLSTLSFRGTGAEHTRVMWEGVPLNSPALGLADLSILPCFLFGQAEIVHGGASALTGVSALGGQIRLEQAPGYAKGVRTRVNLVGGSYGDYQAGGGITAGTARFQSRTSGFYHSAANNFAFKNTALAGAPVVRQTNARFRQYAVLQSFSWQINPNQELKAGVWYQSVFRQIPPSMTVPTAQAVERDSSLRAFVAWKSGWNGGNLRISTSWSDEFVGYVDPPAQVVSDLFVRTSYSEAEFRHLIGSKLIVHGGGIFNASFARSVNFGGTVHDLRGAVFAGAKLEFVPGWTASGILRKDFTLNQNPPLIPLMGLEGILIPRKLKIKGGLSRTFNLPTLNQKYWIPGGNPDLRPERGWNGEIGLELLKLKGFSGELTAYHSRVNDWLLWAPQPNTGLWSPFNLKQVTVNGMEATGRWEKALGKVWLNIKGNYALNFSRNTQTNLGSQEGIIGKQLIYVPVHAGNLNVGLTWKNLWLGLNHQAAGLRYTTTDNRRSLDPYVVGGFNAGYALKSKKAGDFVFTAQLNNIWNASYQAVEWRAMPRLSGQLGLDWQIPAK